MGGQGHIKLFAAGTASHSRLLAPQTMLSIHRSVQTFNSAEGSTTVVLL